MSVFSRWAAGCAAIIALQSLAATAGAQDVTLSPRDGGLSIAGTLLAYDGEFYRIDSEFGELTLDAQAVVCAGPGCPDLLTFVPEILAGGSPTIGEALLPALLEGYGRMSGLELEMQTAPDGLTALVTDRTSGRQLARLGVAFTDSADGIARLIDGQIDIALSLLTVRDPALRARVIALDAFVPVVSPDNDLAAIALADLAAILSGRIESWAALGGPDLPIRLHLRNQGSAVNRLLEQRILSGTPATPAAAPRRHATDAALARAVAADPLGIGLSLRSAAAEARIVPLRGGCGLAREATPLAIKAGDYPLTVPLMLYTRAERLPLQARRLLAFSTGANAQPIVADAGFADQTPTAMPLSAQGERLANAIAAAGEGVSLADLQDLVVAMVGADRLSYTFRFETGSLRLTAQSEGNVERLAEALETGRYARRELVFAGFTDSDGPTAANLRLSSRRAEAVRRAVLDAAPLLDPETVTLGVAGFGEAMPMDCDDTEAGRQVNRRVEVWLR